MISAPTVSLSLLDPKRLRGSASMLRRMVVPPSLYLHWGPQRAVRSSSNLPMGLMHLQPACAQHELPGQRRRTNDAGPRRSTRPDPRCRLPTLASGGARCLGLRTHRTGSVVEVSWRRTRSR